MIFYEVIFYFYWDVQHSFMLTWNHIFKCGFMKIYSGLTGTKSHIKYTMMLLRRCRATNATPEAIYFVQCIYLRKSLSFSNQTADFKTLLIHVILHAAF